VAGLVPAGQLGPLSSLYSFSSKTPLGGTPVTFMIPNLQAFADTLGIYSGTGRFELTGTANASARGNFTTVRERDLDAFAQAVLDTEVGGMRLGRVPGCATSRPGRSRPATRMAGRPRAIP
jgi:hypothetical protein